MRFAKRRNVKRGKADGEHDVEKKELRRDGK